MAERAENQRALWLLERMDADLLTECGCYFGGGTAVSLRCGEPRVSRDVDFLCASHEGYRRLRERVFGKDARALFRAEVEPARELRADRYGVRTAVKVGDAVLKVELVSEGRIELDGSVREGVPVPCLSDEDLVAEKLLANVDRGLDDHSLARDAIDLLLLEDTLGGLPEEAFERARGAYGEAVDRAYRQTRGRLREDAPFRRRCFDALGLTGEARTRAERLLSR